MTDDLARLGRYVRTRREQLGLSQMDVWKKREGPSSTKMGQIEDGQPPTPSASTKAKLEHALEWGSGSVERILSGGEPTGRPERPERVTDLKAWSVHDRPNIKSAGEPENIFNEWAVLYSQLLPYEFRYASARGLTLGAAQDEMREILRMAQESQSGRMWAPPWKWNRPGEPWRASWWETDEGIAFREEMKSDLLRFLEEKDARERDVSAPDDTLDAAANKGDFEPEGVEFPD